MRLPIRLPRSIAALCVVAVAVPFARANASAPSSQSSIAEDIARAARSLVHVSVLFETGGNVVRVERSSSGFVVASNGLVLTNEHLVDEIPDGGGRFGAEYWLQVLLSGRALGATVVARDERLDLALLQLDLEEGELIPALELAPGPRPAPGADVFSIGRPNGASYFALAGVLAIPSGPVAVRNGTLQPGEALITDAAVLDDVDGGPFIGRDGLVVGIGNTFHRLRHAANTDEKEQREKPDYALLVSAAAIRGAFADRLGAASTATGTAPGAQDDAAKIVAAAASAVVGVWAGEDELRPQNPAPSDPYAQRPGKGVGSGVIVDPSGLVFTSSDVVGDAAAVGIRLLDGSTYRGKVLRSLEDKRVALVDIELPDGVKLPAIELGSSAAGLPGEAVAVIGNPFGHTPTVSFGVLSALEVENRIRVGAWTHDGHKGGAVVDVTGRLIGLPVADIFEGEERGKSRAESYLGVALPIDRVREWLAADLEQQGGAAGLRTAPAATEQELAQRRNKVTAIVEATRESLLNVEIKAEKPKAAAFDPFASSGEMMLLGQGSGVVIDASGLAITNWHVAHPTLGPDGAQRDDRLLEVTLASGRRYRSRVLATSRDDDLALIQLEIPEGETVKPVALGASKPLRRGDVAVAIGNPYGKANTVTLGIVAAKDQDANIEGRLHVYQDLLQTDAAINPGNSGGALLDADGRLIGINSAGRSGAGLAIPVERVREVFGQKLLGTMGPFLGVTVEDEREGGLVVRAVEEHGPAAAAGIAVGDRLRTIDGRAVASTVEYGNLLLALRSEAALRLELDRGAEHVTAELKPVSQATWRVFRQTGIQLAEVDYRKESESVRQASLLLHRTYTGLDAGEPKSLMTGALRVVAVHPKDKRVFDVMPGDLLLGASRVIRNFDTEHASLVRFETVRALKDVLEPIATDEGEELECWLLRDGKVHTTRVPVFRPR